MLTKKKLEKRQSKGIKATVQTPITRPSVPFVPNSRDANKTVEILPKYQMALMLPSVPSIKRDQEIGRTV